MVVKKILSRSHGMIPTLIPMLVNKILSDGRSHGTIPTLIPMLVNKIPSDCRSHGDNPDPDPHVS